jgi:hypothetical protein
MKQQHPPAVFEVGVEEVDLAADLDGFEDELADMFQEC